MRDRLLGDDAVLRVVSLAQISRNSVSSSGAPAGGRRETLNNRALFRYLRELSKS
jgi:hypothetical protein